MYSLNTQKHIVKLFKLYKLLIQSVCKNLRESNSQAYENYGFFTWNHRTCMNSKNLLKIIWFTGFDLFNFKVQFKKALILGRSTFLNQTT